MIKDWPTNERPREKLLNQGANSLSDAELLAIFLRTGVTGCHVVDLARKLLSNFGSISGIYRANQQEFCAQHGLGTAKFVQLQACLEMSKRYLAEEIKQGKALTSSQITRDYLITELRHQTREVFAVMFLDNQHQILKFETLFWHCRLPRNALTAWSVLSGQTYVPSRIASTWGPFTKIPISLYKLRSLSSGHSPLI